MARTINEWYDLYVGELTEIEQTSDEEAIAKELAEFEIKLRESYAKNKAEKVNRIKTIISVIEELSHRQSEEDLNNFISSDNDTQSAETASPKTCVTDIYTSTTSTVIEDDINQSVAINPFENL